MVQASPETLNCRRSCDYGDGACAVSSKGPHKDVNLRVHEPPRQLQVEVPADAVPGSTHLSVDYGASYALRVTVPAEARPGDLLILAEEEGTYQCRLVRRPVKTCNAVRVAEVEVPAYATPGETQLKVVIPGDEELLVTVPTVARVGDRLKLSWDDAKQELQVRVVRVVQQQQGLESAATESRKIVRVHVHVDRVSCFEKMATVARAAGAFVNPKLTRGSAPPLHIPGLLAKERIYKDEVLIQMPASLHVSHSGCQRVMPELFNAILALDNIPKARRVEVAHTACIASLLREALDRAEGRCDESSAWPALWHRYADALLGENFDEHPYWKCLKTWDELSLSFGPSAEASFAKIMVGDAVAMHESIMDHVGPEVLRQDVDFGLYLHARLCSLTREFGTVHGAAIVPVFDFFNHSANPGAHQSWDVQEDSMRVTALRDHEAGEELFISYGVRSNPALFRHYGFIIPPALEPTWTYACQVNDLQDFCAEAHAADSAGEGPADMLQKCFLPLEELWLNAQFLTSSLAISLDAIADGGGDAFGLLRGFLARKLEHYKRNLGFQRAVAALDRARETQPERPAWWADMPDGDSEPTAATCVKMSEYICLTAHLEALAFLDGDVPAERCLVVACGLRQALGDGLEVRMKGGRFQELSKSTQAQTHQGHVTSAS
mmetsp:Transcript_101938/g.287707  ORF Transcript_101938/g.287707 Transcript_101938/m.287707 type:complete len:665 (-) Transcript_101938:72-2066(-)